MKIVNIGIFAHVDAGKTTITENLLFCAGAIKKIGKVDDGTTQTDFLEVEKQRGITVRSSHTFFTYKDIQFNLIDTPGHTDFVSDVERVLPVIDSAILIVSAAEGVQPNTRVIWRALEEKNIPVLIFVNKIDRVGVNTKSIIDELKKEFGSNIIPIQTTTDEATNNANITDYFSQASIPETTIEEIVAFDDNLMEQYLEGEDLTKFSVFNSLTTSVRDTKLYPLLFGSAKSSIGMKELLDYLVKFAPTSDNDIKAPFSAYVYSIQYDKILGKTANIKIISGSLKNKDLILNNTKDVEEKVNIIRKGYGNRYKELNEVFSGDIVNVSGLKSVVPGDIIGEENENTPKPIALPSPLLTVQIKPEEEKNYTPLLEAVTILAEEDPSLEFEHIKEERELHIKITGAIQIEILEQIISDRFNIKAKCDKPIVIYKETPKASGFGFVRYWMPKPCWAIMKFLIEPNNLGAGVEYQSKLSFDNIKQKYQNEVTRTIPTALKQGIKGWEVTDIKITLIEGEDHEIHSRPGDFVIATPMGIMQGLQAIGTDLLEPILKFEITAEDALLGSIISDITQMRGTFEPPEMFEGKVFIRGEFPLSTSMDYPMILTSKSNGKAKMLTEFSRYAKCSDEQGVIREFRGISPLDTSKYILKARGAMQ